MNKLPPKIIITRQRDLVLDKKLLKKRLFVYNGKTDKYLSLNRSMLGTKVGAFVPTKKMGKAIHDSERSRKRKNKKNKKK